MFESFTIKRLQAQVNRWADTFHDPPRMVVINGVLDDVTARRALTVIEHGQILLGDAAGQAQTQTKLGDPIASVTADLSNTLSTVRAVSDAEHKPAASFIWPLSVVQTALAVGVIGVGGSLVYLRKR